MDVGARLRALRQMHGLSERELARRAGVTNGLISLVEMNRVSPSVSSLKKVLDGIPISLADFFTLDLDPGPPEQPFYAAHELPDVGNNDIHYYLVGQGGAEGFVLVAHGRSGAGAAPAARGPGAVLKIQRCGRVYAKN